MADTKDDVGSSEPDDEGQEEQTKTPPKKKRGGKVYGEKPKERLDKRSRGGKTKGFHPGGEKGKLHREMGIPEGEKIGTARLSKAAHSSNPEEARDAKRAQTMAKWKH